MISPKWNEEAYNSPIFRPIKRCLHTFGHTTKSYSWMLLLFILSSHYIYYANSWVIVITSDIIQIFLNVCEQQKPDRPEYFEKNDSEALCLHCACGLKSQTVTWCVRWRRLCSVKRWDTITRSVFDTSKSKPCNMLNYCLWYEYRGNSNPKAIKCQRQFRIQPVGADFTFARGSFSTPAASLMPLTNHVYFSKHTKVVLDWMHVSYFPSSRYFWLISFWYQNQPAETWDTLETCSIKGHLSECLGFFLIDWYYRFFNN